MEENKSELLQLLQKNSSIGEGLSKEEKDRARQLITGSVLSGEECWVCKVANSEKVPKALFDTRLCRHHAYYALATRK